MVSRKGIEREDLFGLLQQRGDLGHPALELGDRGGEPVAGLFARGGVEDRSDQCCQHAVLVAAGMPQTVPEEVHGAALPWRSEHLGQRRLEAGVGIGDRQLHPDQAAGDQAAQELAPERLGLGLADVEADDLAPAGLVHAVGDDHALVHHPPAGADLLDLGVDEQIRVAALERPLAERLDLLIQQRTDPTDLAAADAQPQRLDKLIHSAGAHAAHIRLPDHADQRLLRALARRSLGICNSISPARVSHRRPR